MKIWVCVDSKRRIVATNPNDMSGNTGWEETTVAKLGFGVDEPLTNANGVALFTLTDGKGVRRTSEELDADYTPEEPQLTDKQRIASLEEQNAMLTECLLEMSELVYA